MRAILPLARAILLFVGADLTGNEKVSRP
jgi:hypothetical protein